jgi:NAD-dependent dihydropyrimidine dehydrogenase PreA subunit
MKLADLPGYLRDRTLGMFPHPARVGLIRIGNPDRRSPVLVTGNFTLTVRRVRDALRGHDAWLLVANSKGINVWCASGGGYLTHHDIIAAIRVSRLAEKVESREIILPQLCATGVERRRIEEATGFFPRWGPARLEDLPAFLARGGRVIKRERFMRFPAWERLEMATLWCAPLLAILLPILAFFFGARVMGAAGVATASLVYGVFGFLPWLAIQGAKRFLTFAAAAVVAAFIGCGALWVFRAVTLDHAAAVSGAGFLAMAVLSIDLAGTTPWYASYINSFHNTPQIELVAELCTGAAECVQVCPRDVLKMNGRRRKVEISKPDQCIQCAACIVQCPEDALRFSYDDGRVVEAATIRSTRLNLLGRRTIAAPQGDDKSETQSG